MASTEIERAVERIAARYPSKASAIIPALSYVQRNSGNYLTTEDIKGVAQALGVSDSHVYGVATYYTMFNTTPVGKYHIQVDTNIPATLMGAGEILAHLEKRLKIRAGQTTPDGRFTLSAVEDLGSCGTCPVVQVNDIYYENLTVDKVDALIESLKNDTMPESRAEQHFGTACNVLLKNCGRTHARSIDGYKKTGGYQSLAKARAMKAGVLADLAKKAILRGRGGAGFPAGMKWSFLPKNDPRPVYLICNADEGEPGTFKDRQIMEFDPHLLIEGIAIAAHATNAGMAFIYIRGEFEWIARILDAAVTEAKENGVLGALDIVVHRGAGSYVCGEETALIESLEGKRGNPRIKPPFPANVGLYGCPTVVNNVETLACLPYLIEKGADEFKKLGVAGNHGPKIFGVSGHVNKPGVFEFPLGTPLEKILDAAGGVKGTLKGVIVGGLSVPILTAEEAKGLKMDYDSCLKAGTMLGSGGIIVINDTVSIPQIALRTIRFYAHESCGQCTPCREGSVTIMKLLTRLVDGKGLAGDIDTILYLCDTIMGTTLCPTGDAFAMPVRAMVQKYRGEFDALAR